MRRPTGRHALFLRLNSFGEPVCEGYVGLAGRPMLGDPTLYTRAISGSAPWRLYTPLLELIEDSPWQFLRVSALRGPDTWGPVAAQLLASERPMWRRPELQTT